MAHNTNSVQAFLVHDRRIQVANISASESTYTEAGPRPGPALADDACSLLRPQVHAAQAVDLDVAVVRSGRAGPDTSGMIYKQDSEGAANWRSWNPPWVLRGAEIVDYDDGTGSSEDWKGKAIAVIPDSQKLVLAGFAVSQEMNTWTWDPSDRTWTDNGDPGFPLSAGSGIAVVWVPDLCGLLMIGDAAAGDFASTRFSDDEGATWTEHATDVLDTAVDATAAGGAGYLVLDRYGNIFYARANAGTLQTWVSADGGATFAQVELNTGLDADYVDVTTNANGDIVVAHSDGTANDITVSILTDGYGTVANASISTTLTTTALDLTVFSDAENTIYILYRHGSDDTIRSYRSTDNGASFQEAEYFYRADVATAYPDDFVGRMSAGQLVFCTTFTHPTTVAQQGSLVALYAGGWSNIEHDATPPAASPRNRKGWGQVGANARSWPVMSELPENLGFTSTGTAATLSANGWNMATAAAIGTYSHTWTHGTNQACVVAEFRVTTDVDETALYTGFQVQRRNGTAETGIQIRASTTGFTVHDTEAAADEVAVSVDMTDFVQVMIQWNDLISSVTVWYRAHDSDVWVGGNTYTLTGSATASTTSFIEWGHVASGTADTDWRLICVSESKYLRHKIAGGTDYDGFRWGRGLDANPYPLRDQGDATYRTRLSVTGGPARRGDTFTIAARHDYPVDNLDPAISPSPKQPWRSTQVAAAEEIVFDLGDDTLFQPGSFLGLYLSGESTPRTATLQTKPDGGAYTTRGTYDGATGFVDLEYTLDGEVLVPRVGTKSGRFLRDMESAGGYVILADATNLIRKVGANRGGWWNHTGDGASPHIRIEGATGTEKLVSTMTLVAPRGLLLVPFTSETRFRYIKIAFPVQDLPDDYVTTGVAVVGGMLVPGHGMSRGWSMRWIPNTESREDSYGTIHARPRGPVRREFTWSYQDLTDTTALYNDAADHHAPLQSGVDNYIAAADRGDVVDKLIAMMIESRGGSLPVVALLDLPDLATATTITDPRSIVHGLIQGQVQLNHVEGVQGTSEAYRLDTMTIREQPWDRD